MALSKLKKSLQRGKDDDAANHIVALDIGTEFAKALIARIDGQEMSVVGVGRARQDVSDMHSGAISDIGGVVRACEEALSEAEDQAGVQARSVRSGARR
ncbi:MAG: hypothetical protein AAB395_01700, partial [Patescibacteria group bacterium]